MGEIGFYLQWMLGKRFRSNDELVEYIKNDENYLDCSSRSESVLDAMRKVDRRDFLPDLPEEISFNSSDIIAFYTAMIPEERETVEELLKTSDACHVAESLLKDVDTDFYIENDKIIMQFSVKNFAYFDMALPIGCGQTCSQPRIVAFMNDKLELEPGMKVLEIGTGGGYQAAITSHMIGEEGFLYTVENVSQLVKMARENLKNHFGSNVEKRLKVLYRDGSMGLEEYAPFDRIYFTGGVSEKFDYSILSRQLNPGGILLFPDNRRKQLVRQKHSDSSFTEERYGQPVLFVPLKGKNP